MWEAIKEVLTSSNAVGVLIILGFFLLVLIIVAVFLLKSNIIQIHTQAVSTGYADRERNIIRQQLDYVELHLEDAEANLPKDPDYDKRLGREIVLEVKNVYTKWIACNHINRSNEYVSLKQKELLAVVNSMTVNERYKGEDFKKYIKDDTKETILELIKIREQFTNS
jgi:hypothetical protein